MKKKISYAVFTTTDSGMDYMVKGNFGNDKPKAAKWAKDNAHATTSDDRNYPNGLFVKEVKY